ncbi:hypothetical protein [Luteimicrobium subarcticum]|uniref:Uncharacterized protein n=1 Tax=Luteimicrobium subarcticum TaxID=620910 RepID=A0A2M8WVP8_9MICO|nr:hypothetical protein [Luteimicrobium subarcticum]PJI95007.1 hypothetical protein CLV34_0859 [Luteimicrobium subarcticum]
MFEVHFMTVRGPSERPAHHETFRVERENELRRRRDERRRNEAGLERPL